MLLSLKKDTASASVYDLSFLVLDLGIFILGSIPSKPLLRIVKSGSSIVESWKYFKRCVPHDSSVASHGFGLRLESMFDNGNGSLTKEHMKSIIVSMMEKHDLPGVVMTFGHADHIVGPSPQEQGEWTKALSKEQVQAL